MVHIIIDIDECLEAAFDAMDLCQNDKNARCVNTDGSFDCICVPGYTRTVNGSCQRELISHIHELRQASLI